MLQPLYRRVLRLPLERALAPLGESSHSDRSALRRIVESFVDGYNLALRERDPSSVTQTLERVEARWRGFAFEGAGMALGLLDELPLSGPRRWPSMVSTHACRHDYLLCVGLGWSWARLRRRLEARIALVEPTLRWLCVDGYGFHCGFFDAQRTIERRAVPAACRGYAARAFDQGLGRCLWFHVAATPDRIANAIESFEARRQADLWSGVGLAVAYAGGVSVERALDLSQRARAHRAHFAQGVAFALEARSRGGNEWEHTTGLAEALWFMPAQTLVELVAQERQQAVRAGGEIVYEDWRGRVRTRFVPQEASRVLAR